MGVLLILHSGVCLVLSLFPLGTMFSEHSVAVMQMSCVRGNNLCPLLMGLLCH